MKRLPGSISPEHFCTFLEDFGSGKKDHLMREVLSYYEFLIEQGSRYPDYLYPSAILALFLGEREKAIRYTEQLLKLNSTFKKYIMLREHIETGKHLKVEQDVIKSIDEIIDPFIQCGEKKFKNRSAEYPFYVSDIMVVTGKYLLGGSDVETAFYCFLAAFLCGAPRDSIFYLIGFLFYKNNDIQTAYRYLNESIHDNPTNITALLDLSHVAIELGNREASFVALQHAYSLYPDYADIAYRMAQFYLEEKNYEKTRECLERALRANPMYTVASITYFYVLFKIADQKTIRAYIDTLTDDSLRGEFEFLYSLRFDVSLDNTVSQLCAITSYEQKLLDGVWDRFLSEIPSERYTAIFETLLKTQAINEGAYKIIKGRLC